MTFPHMHPGQWPDKILPSRFASSIRRNEPSGCQVALIGIPDDTGVKLNNGRPGAAEGPNAIRAALSRYGVAKPGGWDWPIVYDAGDVAVVPGNLEQTHSHVTEAVQAVVAAGLFPIGIGGGHDLTFPFVRGAAKGATTTPWHGVYFDPHLDVRETPGSGMPFRKLIETSVADALTIVGFQPLANTHDHVEWFRSHGGLISQDKPEAPWPDRETFVSFDMDVLDQACAPGVSALNPCGWTPTIAERWVATAGRNPRVRCFDIMELSPPNDPSGHTARLAAHLLLCFLHAYTERST
ncbi:MAG: formimidoylglutamase [Planctomycetota bacterium]